MTALDRTIQLQKQGFQDNEIVSTLQQEGFQMRDINDSLNQARIKNAVSQESDNESTMPEYATPSNPSQPEYSPQSYPDYNSNDQYSGYDTAQSYDNNYQNQTMGSTETITDIAEQVFNEKTQKLIKELNELVQNNKTIQRDFQELKEKLKRIEDNLDYIQKAVIGKIGEFGESTRLVQKDLENIHGTMSKMMNPLIENYNELKKLNTKKL